MTVHGSGDVPGEGQPHALVERRGHVLIVTMNRPEARNALTGPMMELMRQAWDLTDSDPGIRVCVLTGAGGAFCAGADLKAMTRAHPGRFPARRAGPVGDRAAAQGPPAEQAADRRGGGRGDRGRHRDPASVRHQGGRQSARFGISEARWGLFPLGGSAVRLPRQIPYTVAADLLLTGRHITAAEALSAGLIGQVVPDGQALARALEIAELIAANGPVAVRAILQVIRATEGLPENEAFAIEAKAGVAVFASEDAKEGPRAFAEKRRPQFRGR